MKADDKAPLPPLFTRPNGDFEQLCATLEALVDVRGVKPILEALAELCEMKAAHIRENWQDDSLAKSWDTTARAIDATTKKVRV